MISFNELIQIYLAEKNTYYSLWVFYFTSSAAVLGFVYGGTNNSQLISTIVTVVLYLVIVLGNSNAIFTTQKTLKATQDEMQDYFSECKQLIDEKNIVNTEKIVSEFAISTLEDVKFHYWLGTLLVIFGILFPYSLNSYRNGFRQTIT